MVYITVFWLLRQNCRNFYQRSIQSDKGLSSFVKVGHAWSCRQRIPQGIFKYLSPLIANILFCKLSKRLRNVKYIHDCNSPYRKLRTSCALFGLGAFNKSATLLGSGRVPSFEKTCPKKVSVLLKK